MDGRLCLGSWMLGHRFLTVGFTVGFPPGFVVVVAPSLGRVGDKGCSGGRSALAVPRSGVDKLSLVDVMTGTPLGGAGVCLSESSALLAPASATPVGAACFLKTASWTHLCARAHGESLCLFSDSAAATLRAITLLVALSLSSRVRVQASARC